MVCNEFIRCEVCGCITRIRLQVGWLDEHPIAVTCGKCGISLSPVEAERLGGICPVCGKKLTMGVDHRVEQLADRAEGFVKKDGKKYESLVPLPEVISACMRYSTASKKVQGCFEQMIQTLGTEFDILRNVPAEDIKSCAGERIAEGIENVRTGNVKRIPGYDGEYGKIELFCEN